MKVAENPCKLKIPWWTTCRRSESSINFALGRRKSPSWTRIMHGQLNLNLFEGCNPQLPAAHLFLRPALINGSGGYGLFRRS